jgi:starch synthase
MSRILFACSEAHPLIKTGGLADVSGSLPPVLQALGDDVRVVLPAYRQVLQRLPQLPVAAELSLPDSTAPVRILEATLPQTDVTVWLVDAPAYFDRDGGPYLGPDGHDWPDNAARYTLFARAVVELAQDRAGLAWRPDVVHCNDWQTGLVPALLAQEPQRPGTVFTIHNMAYQGLFTRAVFDTLGLPESLWHMEAMEFYSQFNFLKGGLSSPTGSPPSAQPTPRKSAAPPTATAWRACSITAPPTCAASSTASTTPSGTPPTTPSSPTISARPNRPGRKRARPHCNSSSPWPGRPARR